MNKTIRDQAVKLRSKWRKIVTGDEKKRVRDHLKEAQNQPKYIKWFDKVAFTLGVLNIAACQYFLLNMPEYFWLWYSMVMPILIASRFLHFKSLNWQYFMIDFCYFSVACTMLNLFVIRNSPLFFKVCFIFTTGPLTSAVVIWRNSFIFHDFDKIATVYIHVLPCMLYFTLRWGVDGSNTCLRATCEPLTLFDYFIALLLYLFWQACYLLKTEVLDKKKFDAHPELLTSLRWMTSDTKNPLARAILRQLRRVRIFGRDEDYDSTSMKTKLVFVGSQLVTTLLAFIPTPLFYNYAWCHLSYIGALFVVTVFNGASFYIEVFSRRYYQKIAKLEELHAVAKEASSIVNAINKLEKSDADAKVAGKAESEQQSTSANPELNGRNERFVSNDSVTSQDMMALKTELMETSESAWAMMKRKSERLDPHYLSTENQQLEETERLSFESEMGLNGEADTGATTREGGSPREHCAEATAEGGDTSSLDGDEALQQIDR